jgi:gluconate 2-dehydrogenase alpha chain
MTFDFAPNELKMSAFLTDRLAEIGRAMGPSELSANPRKGHYSIVPYQTTHNVGGAAMGTNPRESVVNRYLQHWQVPNLFVHGAAVFPQNAGYNPTGTIAALTLMSARKVIDDYLKSPGPLVPA